MSTPSIERAIEAQVQIIEDMQWQLRAATREISAEERMQKLLALKTATEVLKNLTEALSYKANAKR